jgi:hypothetical protein
MEGAHMAITDYPGGSTGRPRYEDRKLIKRATSGFVANQYEKDAIKMAAQWSGLSISAYVVSCALADANRRFGIVPEKRIGSSDGR